MAQGDGQKDFPGCGLYELAPLLTTVKFVFVHQLIVRLVSSRRRRCSLHRTEGGFETSLTLDTFQTKPLLEL